MTEKTELTTIADFINFLCDQGCVVAKPIHGTNWIPITEEEGDALAQQFLARPK